MTSMTRQILRPMLLLALVALALSACGGGENDTPAAKASPVEETPTAFVPCEPGPRGGGFEVWIRDISCQEVRPLLRSLGGRGDIVDSSRPLGTDDGSPVSWVRRWKAWECLSTKVRANGPISHSCVRGGQLVVFQAG